MRRNPGSAVRRRIVTRNSGSVQLSGLDFFLKLSARWSCGVHFPLQIIEAEAREECSVARNKVGEGEAQSRRGSHD